VKALQAFVTAFIGIMMLGGFVIGCAAIGFKLADRYHSPVPLLLMICFAVASLSGLVAAAGEKLTKR
jgi:hypothetical protein